MDFDPSYDASEEENVPAAADREPGPDDLTREGDAEEDEGEAFEYEHGNDAIKLYLRQIQKTRLLSAEEEVALAARIAGGDKTARDRMIESNLRLVVKIARRYAHRDTPLLDLIAEGNIGLIKAVERFDPAKECRFSTYATWWIRQTIERSVDNQARAVRLPVHVAEECGKLYRTTRELVGQMNREPSEEELAAAMGVDVAKVRRLMLLFRRTYSMERPMGEEGDLTLLDMIEDTSNIAVSELFENVDTYRLVMHWIETLSENERNILTLRFGLDDTEPQTLDALGQAYGLTRERIRQIEVGALKKLRNIIADCQGGGGAP